MISSSNEKLNLQNVEHFILTFNPDLSKSFVKKMFKIFDSDKNGYIDFKVTWYFSLFWSQIKLTI